MFEFEFSELLEKKLDKLAKKDRKLATIFSKKVIEIINQDHITINTYKNLKAPMNDKKRIHLTDKFILLFKVEINENNIIFVDIVHWDKAYKGDKK
jgi:mRNA-degrading endonuclease RelE of RelBE toxin-antitoxin system